MPKVRVHNFSISLDGYGAGPAQNVDDPLGIGGELLHTWVFKTRGGRQMLGQPGGDEGVDNDFWMRGDERIGATVMGRNMFGPIRGPWGDEEWKGWWGDEPPYHHPVFVLTHHPHDPIPMEGGTTFHFVTDGIEPRWSKRWQPPAARTSASAAARRRSRSTWRPDSSTSCTWRSHRSCSALARDSSTSSAVPRRATSASSS